MSSQQQNLDAAIAAWNNSDLDGYLALYDEAITLHGYTPEPMDKTAARSFYAGIFAAFPDTKLVFHDVIWTDDRVAIRFTMTGTHQGDFMGVAVTGREIALPGITILHSRATVSSSAGRRPTCLACSSSSGRSRHPPDRDARSGGFARRVRMTATSCRLGGPAPPLSPRARDAGARLGSRKGSAKHAA